MLLSATFIDMTTQYAWQVLPLNDAGQYVMFEHVRPTTATGTGLIDSFLKLSAGQSGVEQGYNTDASLGGDPVLADVFNTTHSLSLASLPLVTVAGKGYREFWLDVNEQDEYLSLDKLQIFLGDDPALTGYPGFGGRAQEVFNMDVDLAAADATDGAWIGLQYLYAGSGQGDYRFFIPQDLFQSVLDAHPTYQYVYLYSKFGGDGTSQTVEYDGSTVTNWPADDGGEEWFVFKTGADRGSISGYKFEDLNGSGTRNEGEPGLEDWTINLYTDNGDGVFGAGDTLADHLVTSTTGDYAFIGLKPGKYWVREVQQTDWTQKTPDPGLITVSANSDANPLNNAGLAFGNARFGGLSGYKYEDIDGDGNITEDTGNPLNDWTIELYKWVGGAWVEQAEAVTGDDAQGWADGYYEFSQLPVGAYRVQEVVKDNWAPTAPNVTDPNYYDVDVVSGETQTGNDFGNFELGGIRGYKFEDIDGDGSDDSDPRLSGWTINLYLDDGDGVFDEVTPIDTELTVATTGAYSFTGLAAGSYWVREQLKNGWSQTTDNPALIAIASGDDITPTEEAGLAFGNFELGWISGYKFEDIDGDGSDDSDPRLSGWTINLYLDDGDGVFDEVTPIDTELTVATTGAYSFTGLAAGSYWVREQLQSGWSQTTDNPALIAIASGDDITPTEEAGLAFGNFQNLDLSGYKWLDADGDGSWDGTEAGDNGWTIYLDKDTDPTNGVIRSMSTINNGTHDGGYAFLNVTSTEIGGATTLYVYEATGGSDWVKSYGGYTVNPVSGLVVAGDYGQTEQGNFGNYQLAGFGGVKFEDLQADGFTGDGVNDGSDPGLGGFVIRAYEDLNGDGDLDQADYNHGVVASDTSDNGTGAYYLDLAPGKYIIVEVVQIGSFQTFPTVDVVGTVTTTGGTLGQYGYAVTLASGQDEDDNDFGNYVSRGDAHSPGFWASKNGQAQIESMVRAGIDVWGTLRALNLRNENGSPYNPSSDPRKFTDFSRWLRGGNSRNAAYMLSVQLATMELNVLAGWVDLTDRVFLGNPDPILVIGDVMRDANTLLGNYGVIGQTHPQRSYANYLMDILAKANTNLNWWVNP